MKTYPHLISNIFNRPMLSTPELMMEAVIFAQSHLGLLDITSRSIKQKIGFSEDDDEVNDSEDECDDGSTSLGQINVYGPLVARTGNLKMCQTMTAYESIVNRLNAMDADPSITRIAMIFDTNGGDATGAFECADVIRDVSTRKPIHAMVNFKAFSGGCLLSTAATEVSVSQSSGVGSIGVISKYVNIEKALAGDGVEVKTFYRGDRKADMSPDMPLSEGAEIALNENLDRIYVKFTEYVAKHRDLSIDQVVATQAGCFFGEQAISIGLADRLETPQEFINRVSDLAKEDLQLSSANQKNTLSIASNSQRMKLSAAAMDMRNSM